MNRRRRLLSATVALTAAEALCLAPARAADAPVVGEVVVVGAPQDAAGVPLSRIPANAQSLAASEIERRSPTNLADVLDRALGSVSVSNGAGNPYQNDVNYRGFQATSLLGAPVGLAVYFDGVRVNEPFGAIVNWDLIPLDAAASVQVQPGSNPLFGLNALGGALVVTTRTGQDSPGAAVSVLGGSFGRRAATLQAGGSDAGAGVDYFLAGDYDRQDGWRDHSPSEVKQLFGKLRWRGPADRTLVELSGAYADTSLSGTQALPMDMGSDPKAAYTWPDRVANRMRLVNLKASRKLDDANQLSGQVYWRRSDARSLNSNAGLDDGCFTDDGALAAGPSGFKCANAAPDGTAANAVTGAAALALGYGRWTSAINSSLVNSTTLQDTVGVSAQWANATPVAGRKNALMLGGTFDQSDIDYRQDTRLARLIGYETVAVANRAYGFTADGLAPSPGNPPAFTGSNTLGSVSLGARMKELAVYASDTIDLTARFSVTAAGSFDYTAIDQSGVNAQDLNPDGGYAWTDDVTGVAYYNPGYVGAFRYANGAAGAVGAPIGAPAGAVAGPETSRLDGAHRYQRFNPRIGFTYALGPAVGLFGGYSESMRAPTSIELSCADPGRPCALPTGFNGDPDLKAVTARTVELGGRGLLAGKVGWNAALYDSRLRNDIQFISTSATVGYFANVGGAERRGLELGARAELGRLSLSADYGYVEALYRSPFTTVAGQTVRSGDRIPGVPSSTFKLRAGWRVSDRLRLGGAVIAAGEQYAHGDEGNADPAGKVGGYAVVDLDAEYRIGRALKLSLGVDNLLDQRYATYGLAGVTSIYTLTTQTFRTPAAPRGVWLKATYAFGAAAARLDDDQ